MLSNQMEAKYGAKAVQAEAIASVKEGDTVSYVDETGVGREAKVISISGESATLEIILPDGQVVEKSGVKYLSTPDKEDEKVVAKKGGRRGKAKEDKSEVIVPRDIQKMRDTAVLYEDQDGPYWHV